MKKTNLQPGDLFNCGDTQNYCVTYAGPTKVKFKNVFSEEKFNYNTNDVERYFEQGDWTLLGIPEKSKPSTTVNKEVILNLIANTLFKGQDDSMTLDTQVNLIYTQWKANLK